MSKFPSKAVSYLHAVVFALVASVIALPSSAALLKFTYTSNPLPLSAVYWDDSEIDFQEMGIDLPPLSFTLSFNAAEQDLSQSAYTHFFINDFTFAFTSEANYFSFPLNISASSQKRVTLNKQGDVIGWNLRLIMTEQKTPETDPVVHKLSNNKIDLISRSGNNTCNCDIYEHSYHPVTWHRHWIQLIPIELQFAAANQPSNWTIERIDVPEPGLAGLFFSGLAILLWCRRRDRGLIR